MTEIIRAEVVWKALDIAAKEAHNKTGYIYQGREITFKEMDEISDRVACGLLGLGFKKGDRIGIIGLNQPEWLYTYFAASKIGAVIVGLNVRYRNSELDYILNHSEAGAIVSLTEFGDMDYVKFFDEFRTKIPSVKKFIFLGEVESSPDKLSFDSILKTPVDRKKLDEAKGAVRPEDLLMIIYTSGTTGRPKGAAISHKSQLAAAEAEAHHIKLTEGDLFLNPSPLNHVGGITCITLTVLLAMVPQVLVPVFKADEIVKLSAEYQPSIVSGVPTMFQLMLLNENFDSWDSRHKTRLAIAGGSNIEPSLFKQIQEAWPNAFVMSIYGSSETSGAAVMTPWECDTERNIQSVGKPIGKSQYKVIGKNGERLATGETGELCIKGDSVVSGYFNMPDETAEAFDEEGWVHMGDLAYIDQDGYIMLMGRTKEMYIQGGFNVYPAEIENVLAQHPKILMSAGIGVPDPVMGEIGKYYIVPKADCHISEEEVKTYCKKHLADYKVPKQIVFRSELPLTPMGKIMKARLQEYENETNS